MLYDFLCIECNHQQVINFSAIEYDNNVHLDGLYKHNSCEMCGKKSLYRHITQSNMPSVMGGTKGYKSIDKYWSDNPALRRAKEEEVLKQINDRRERNWKKRKNAPMYNEPENRHKDYGPNSKEDKLKLDEK